MQPGHGLQQERISLDLNQTPDRNQLERRRTLAECRRLPPRRFDAKWRYLEFVPVRRRRPKHDLASSEIADGANHIRGPNFFANTKAFRVGEFRRAVERHRKS